MVAQCPRWLGPFPAGKRFQLGPVGLVAGPAALKGSRQPITRPRTQHHGARQGHPSTPTTFRGAQTSVHDHLTVSPLLLVLSCSQRPLALGASLFSRPSSLDSFDGRFLNSSSLASTVASSCPPRVLSTPLSRGPSLEKTKTSCLERPLEGPTPGLPPHRPTPAPRGCSIKLRFEIGVVYPAVPSRPCYRT